MASAAHMLPPPPPLDIHDTAVAEKWRDWRQSWHEYALATDVDSKSEDKQVAVLLTALGPAARKVYQTFNWSDAADARKIEQVLAKFDEFCRPRENIPFERYKFNVRQQEPGESFEKYLSVLRMMANRCNFDNLTPDDVLRDRILFGIADSRVRERLLREDKLTLAKTVEICRAAEMSKAQIKAVNELVTVPAPEVHAVGTHKNRSGVAPRSNTKSGMASQKSKCKFCTTSHELVRGACPARDKTCRICHRKGHFAAKCYQRKDKAVHAVDDSDSHDSECFTIFEVSTVRKLDDDEQVTLRARSGKYIRFQIDTGAQCNVISAQTYKSLTGDYKLAEVNKCDSAIVNYDGTHMAVIGTVCLPLSRRDKQYRVHCRVINGKRFRSILGRRSAITMQLINLCDNDQIHMPDTQGAEVLSAGLTDSAKNLLSKDDVMREYPAVFSEGVGRLDGEYNIQVDSSVPPVQHPPRRVQVALHEKLHATLNQLVKQDIIAQVTEPTPWVSSMVVVPKKDGSLRLCLDPKDLNRAVLREHYPLPVIEDVAVRFHKARLFTVLDVRQGFWHVVLSQESSYLTTFNTPFGRYRWKRLPFGIRSAPEVFQRRMHQLIEGLRGVEVIADDFCVVGYGETDDEAAVDHDRNLRAFLTRCTENNVKLNADKFQLRQAEVPFIGHVASNQGLQVSPEKVRAILDMPVPTDVKAVQRFLGAVQYLAKFLPCLSDMTGPLRELTRGDTVWFWGPSQNKAMADIKAALSCTPVLRYYSLDDPVEIQCDSSSHGIGAALLQRGQPVMFASRALTEAETHYAQIEKELLAIVFACTKFDIYIYGRSDILVETDHKPLETIFKKQLCDAPTRLQRMLLVLQKYDLRVVYKKGTEMYLADMLSRAHLNDVQQSSFVSTLEVTDHRDGPAVSTSRWKQIDQFSACDPVMQKLRQTIQHGWPNTRIQVDPSLAPYYEHRDILTVQGNLVFRGQQVLVPHALRHKMIEIAHSTHIGAEGCLRRCRESLYWPRMSAEVRDYVSKCDICLRHRDAQPKEPLLQHEVNSRPWSRIATDLCEIQGRTLLVVVDYYSGYIEVESLKQTTSRAVIKSLKQMFSRYGTPDVLVSDNGPQYASEEFARFAADWQFEHMTSSPSCPRSNGRAENAVKTVKRLFTKCREDGISEFQALLDWRNTPTEGIGTSPAQRLMGRRCKTLLPTTDTLLKPQYDVDSDARALSRMKEISRRHYNRDAHPLIPLKHGEVVRMKLPGQHIWTPAIVSGEVAPRSYEVRVGGTVYRRNRRDLLRTNEQSVDDWISDITGVEAQVYENNDSSTDSSTSGSPTSTAEVAEQLNTEQLNAEHGQSLRRSTRTKRVPERFKDYC